ncbi:MAG: hypothetical protein P8X82_03050 [Gemmatimonadales bacterium]
MTLPWWLWLIPISSTLLFLWFLQKSPARKRHVDATHLRRFLSEFVQQSVSGSVMVLEREQAPGVLHLTLRANNLGGHDLELGVPDVDWSNESFEALAESFRDAGYEVLLERGGRCATVRRLLTASTSGEAGSLAESGRGLVELAATARGWGSETTYTVHFEKRGRNPTTPGT